MKDKSIMTANGFEIYCNSGNSPQVQKQLKENKVVLKYWNTTTPNSQFTEDLDQL